jgi:hypothetical protein
VIAIRFGDHCAPVNVRDFFFISDLALHFMPRKNDHPFRFNTYCISWHEGITIQKFQDKSPEKDKKDRCRRRAFKGGSDILGHVT